MTLASPWALAVLVVLAPLVALHLRDRGRAVREVPSLLVWDELEVGPPPRERGLRLPALPLALALQAAAVILLAVALAAPHGTASRAAPGRVVVLDDSLWMSAPGRLADAERAARAVAAAAPRRAPVAIVLADGAPATLYRGAAAGVAAALARVAPSAAPADLAGALEVAAGLLGGPHDRITVIRAPQDAMPATIATRGELREVAVGTGVAGQALGVFGASARCGIGSAGVCEIEATLRNGGDRVAADAYTAQVPGRAPLTERVRLAGGASALIVLTAQPGEAVTLRLAAHAGLPGDDAAAVLVPGVDDVPPAGVVTLVGTRVRSLALAQALAAVPGTTLRLRTPATYRAADARSSDLVVLDGWLPRGSLPPAPAVALVNPPRLPGGAVGPALQDAAVSGSDGSSPLLRGVDLASLAVDPGAARRLTLPGWIVRVAWSPGGPLLAAGDDGRQRVAVLAFEPRLSNLPQLPAFPLLAADLVRWAAGWAPGAAVAGQPFLADATPGARTATLERGGAVVAREQLSGAPVALVAPAPGLYTVTETGPGVRREEALAVSAAPATGAAAAPVDLRAPRTGPRGSPPPSFELAFLVAALALVVLELLYAAAGRGGTARRRAVAR